MYSRSTVLRIQWIFGLCLGCAGSLSGQESKAWTEPFPAHRIAGDLYYVGTRGLASYLVATPEGHILLNSSLETSVPLP